MSHLSEFSDASAGCRRFRTRGLRESVNPGPGPGPITNGVWIFLAALCLYLVRVTNNHLLFHP